MSYGDAGRSCGLAESASRVFPGRQSNFRKAPPGPAVFLVGGRGVHVWDADGRDYLDLVLGGGQRMVVSSVMTDADLAEAVAHFDRVFARL